MNKIALIIVVVLIVLAYLYYTSATKKVYGPPVWGAKHGYLGHTGAVTRGVCPEGSYVANMYGTSADWVNGIGFKCSDGTNFGPFGSKSGNAFSANSPVGGWNTISGNAGWWNDRILTHGGDGGAPYSDSCPAGKYVTGMEINTDNTAIGGLQFACNTV